MSKKEYEVEFHDDYITLKEVEPPEPIEYRTNPNPTAREKLGKKVQNISRGKKLFLVWFFDIYGFIYRLTSNRVLGILLCVVEYALIFSAIPYLILPFINTEMFSQDPSLYYFLAIKAFPIFLALIVWIIDIITVTIKNDITFLGKVKYKNFEE